MPIRFKRGEGGYVLEVKLPVPAGKRGSWKHVCYLTRAGDIGMVDQECQAGGYWVAILGRRGTHPNLTQGGAVSAFVSFMEAELKRDTNRINFIRDPYDARLEGEKLFVMDRQLVVEELRRHFPRADA